MKIRDFWDVVPCSVIGEDWRSEVLTVSIIDLMMEAVRTSEKSVYYNGTIRRYIPEGSNLQKSRVLSVECQSTKAVLTQTCIGVFLICWVFDTIFSMLSISMPPSVRRWLPMVRGPQLVNNALEQWYSTGGTRRHPKILFFVIYNII
jgi:hypothetical protein